MEWLTSLHTTMVIIVLVTIGFGWRFFFYRRMLGDALNIAHDSDVEPVIRDNIIYRKLKNGATESYQQYSMFWIPLVWLTLFVTALLWLSLYMKMDMLHFATAVALLVSAVITRSFLYDHSPAEVMDWNVDMMKIYNEAQFKKCSVCKEALVNRASEIEALPNEQRTIQHTTELLSIAREMLAISIRFDMIASAAASIAEYYKDREETLKKKEPKQ